AAPGTDGGETAGDGTFGVTLFVQPGQVGAERPAGELPGPGVLDPQPLAGEVHRLRQVLPVRLHRVSRSVLLHTEVSQEVGQGFTHEIDSAGGSGRGAAFHSPARSPLTSAAFLPTCSSAF